MARPCARRQCRVDAGPDLLLLGDVGRARRGSLRGRSRGRSHQGAGDAGIGEARVFVAQRIPRQEGVGGGRALKGGPVARGACPARPVVIVLYQL